MGMFLLVNYKVRSFYEKDSGTAGADVIIYSDTGDVIDTILVTTESTYNDLVKQLDDIDEKYIDKQDLLTILQNTSGEIVAINATYLNGQSADFYAKNNHDHNTMYAPLSHVNVNASENNYGHVKIINNLSRGSFVTGEALSAYQGKLLSDQIDTMQPKLEDTGWDTWPITGSSINAYDPPYCRKYGKLVVLSFNSTVANTLKKDKIFFTLKSEFRPDKSYFDYAITYGGTPVAVAIKTDGTCTFGKDISSETGIRINAVYFTK